MIENTQDDDFGFYECIATNYMGEVKSRKAKMAPEEQQDEGYNEAGNFFAYLLLFVTLWCDVKLCRSPLTCVCTDKFNIHTHFTYWFSGNVSVCHLAR